MSVYALATIFKPQFVGGAAAALTFAPTGVVAVPTGYQYQITVLHVANVTNAPVNLTMWRVPSGATNDNQHLVVPIISIPVASNTSPYFDVTALWGSVLNAGDAIFALAGSGSALSVQGDGVIIQS